MEALWEQNRQRCLQRLRASENNKFRHHLFIELASIETQREHHDEALDYVREAIAAGFDDVDMLQNPNGPFLALHALPSFHALLQGLCGEQQPHAIVYATGEIARCSREGLLCQLCKLPLFEPLIHEPCAEAFCTRCLTPGMACPQCHEACSEPTSLVRCAPRIIRSALDRLKCHCPRCQHIVERGQLPDHLAACPVICPHGCRRRIAPAELHEHESQCAAVSVACSATEVGCPWGGLRRDLATHARKCLYVKQRPILSQLMARLDVLEQKFASLTTLCAAAEAAEAAKENNLVHNV